MKPCSSLPLVALAGLSLSAHAATVSVSTTAPTVDGGDIANLVTPTATHKWFDDVEHDAGQTFTPETDGFVRSITIYLSSPNENDGANENIDLRLGTISRPGDVFTFSDIYVENAAWSMDWAADDYVTFAFDTPQPVTAGVEYGLITDASRWAAGRTASRTATGPETPTMAVR